MFQKGILFLSLLFLSVFYACTTNPDDIVPPQRVEVFAPLVANETAEVALKKIFLLGETIDTLTNFYDNASIYLLENGVFFDSLRHTANGLYVSTKKIRAEQTYVLNGEIGTGVSFASQAVTIPADPKNLHYFYREDTINTLNTSLSAAYLELLPKKNMAMPYFAMGFANPNVHGFSFTEKATKEINDCNAPFYLLKSIFPRLDLATVYDNQCISLDKLPFGVQKSYLVVEPLPPYTSKEIFVSTIVLNYASVSKELFLWAKNTDEQPTGAIRFAVDPLINYTNLTDAQGVVFGMYKKQITLQQQ